VRRTSHGEKKRVRKLKRERARSYNSARNHVSSHGGWGLEVVMGFVGLSVAVVKIEVAEDPEGCVALPSTSFRMHGAPAGKTTCCGTSRSRFSLFSLQQGYISFSRAPEPPPLVAGKE
jgi:hypothetical protein